VADPLPVFRGGRSPPVSGNFHPAHEKGVKNISPFADAVLTRARTFCAELWRRSQASGFTSTFASQERASTAGTLIDDQLEPADCDSTPSASVFGPVRRYSSSI
jgi:hypothetical protein